jgi:hypothetical protein
MLSPNGSSDTCISDGVFHIPMPCFHGAPPPAHSLAPLAQLVAKLRMATQLIITCYPAVGHLIAPRLQHLQTLLVAGLIAHVLGHVACLASVRIPCPVLRQRQAEVEQGMVVATDISHKDADLAVVDLPPVATPLAFHPYRMRAALGEAAGIEGDDTIGFAEPIGHLSD